MFENLPRIGVYQTPPGNQVIANQVILVAAKPSGQCNLQPRGGSVLRMRRLMCEA